MGALRACDSHTGFQPSLRELRLGEPFGTRWNAILPKIFAARIPVSARTSQAWLRRFNSAFASRFYFGLQTLTVKSRLLTGENTVRIRGDPPIAKSK